MNKKKLIIIIDSLKSGGAEKVLIGILNKLNYDKYLVDLLLINKVGEYIENIPNCIRVFNLIDTYNRKATILDRVRFRLYYNNPKFINKLLKKKYDIGVAFLEGDSTRILNELNNIEYKIAWVHTDVTKHNNSINNNLYNNINKVICVSENAKIKFMQKYKIQEKKIDVIYNGIDFDELYKLSNEYSVNFNSVINIVSVGRLVKAKGFDILINVCEKIIKSGIDIKLYIIGDGVERENLESIIDKLNISENVELVGFKKNPYPYIRAASLCVSSSRYEGFSLFLAESMILKKNIVSTKTQGALELLKDGEFGLLCECENIDELEDKIREAILNYKKIDNINLDKEIERFNQKNIIKQIDNLFCFR